MDAIGAGTNEEDSSINIVSDGENAGNNIGGPHNGMRGHFSPGAGKHGNKQADTDLL